MEKKRKIGIITGIILGVVALITGGFLLYLRIYYGSRWYPGTTINGIDVSRQTLEDSRKKLTEVFRDYALTVTARDGGSLMIRGRDLDYTVDSGNEWDELYEKQHESFVLFSRDKEYSIAYNVSYDESKLQKKVADSQILLGSEDYKIVEPASAYARYDKEKKQYVCVEEVWGNKIRSASLIEALKKALQEARIEIDITDREKYPDVYEAPRVTSQDEALKKELSLCNNAALRFITWNMGEGVTESITPNTISKWITCRNGKIKYNESALEKWVEKFCAKYKTVGITRTLKSHESKKVKKIKVSGGDYGWQLDYNKTVQQAKKALKKKIDSSLTEAYIADPSDDHKKALTMKQKVNYLNTAFKKDYENFREDWDPDNYTEVSIAKQMVYVIRKGKVAFQCRCISGRPVKGRETPRGAFFIKEHRRNYTMRGDDYETFVKCWVRITWTGTGFHPATWQPWSRWSKDLYKTRGSHGCLNLQPADAERIYSMVKYRELVFIH